MSSSDISVLGVLCPFWSDEGPHFILPHFQGMMKTLGVGVRIIDLNIEAAIALKERWNELIQNRDGVLNNQQIVIDCIEKSGIVERLDNAIDIQKPTWLVFLSINIVSYQTVLFLIRHIRSRFSKRIRIAVGGPLFLGLKESNNFFSEADLVWQGTLESAIPIFMGQQKLTHDYTCHRFLPDFTDIDYNLYSRPEQLSYVLNYGCRFRCRYCYEGSLYSKEIRRPTLGLSNHLKTLFNALPTVKYIRFFDSSLNSNHEQFFDILDELDGENLPWVCSLMPMPYIDRSFATRMRSSGCIHVNIGVESGSIPVRKLMGKPTQLEVIESCIRDLHASGVDISINLMVGYPGETENDFKETLLFTSRVADFVYNVNVSITTIYAGTPLFTEVEKLGIHLNGGAYSDIMFVHWNLADGSNTLSIRNERLQRIETHLEKLGLKNTQLLDTEALRLRAKLILQKYADTPYKIS